MTSLVMKFGGTSVDSTEAIKRAADIILEQAQGWDNLVVVVSAMSGVTNALTQGALSAASGEDGDVRQGGDVRGIVADLRVRHYRVVDELFTADAERAPLLAVIDGYLDEFAAFFLP